MGATKYPRTERELAKVEAEARKYPKDSDEYRTFMTLRYTMMHVCCLYRPESQITETEDGLIVWWRPLKGRNHKKGQWGKLPGILKSKELDFSVQGFYEEILKRKRKTGNMYFQRIIRRLGESAGFSDLTPNTLRHSGAVYMIEELKLPLAQVAEILGCSVLTLQKHYATISKKSVIERMKASGW